MAKIKFYKLNKQTPKGENIESITKINGSADDIKKNLAKQAELAKKQMKTEIKSKNTFVYAQSDDLEL